MKAFIIEDDILWRTKLEMIAAKIGLAVIGKAETIHKSREFLSAHTPDVIISDIMLGDDVIFDLFADGKFTDIPVLFVTQSVNPENYHQARHLKYSHFIVKPFAALSLQAAIDILMKPFADKPAEPVKAIAVRGKHNEKISVPVSEIVHVQQDRNYCFIKTAHQKFALKTSLSNMQIELGEDFMQVNRACIINKYFIVQMSADNVHLKVGSEMIIIGRTFRDTVLQYLSEQKKL